jgi:hypothetical protein
MRVMADKYKPFIEQLKCCEYNLSHYYMMYHMACCGIFGVRFNERRYEKIT